MNIGIIGSADGPTAILISSSNNSYLIAGLTICIIVGVIIFKALKKKKNK